MEDVNPVSSWDPPPLSQSAWEDMLNDLLQEPAAEAGVDPQVLSVDEGWRGLVNSCAADITGVGEGPNSDPWWAVAPADLVLDQDELQDLANTFIDEENISVPCLSSEVSSYAEGDLLVANVPKASEDTSEKNQHAGVSSPESCSSVQHDCAPASNGVDEVGNGSSRSHSPIVTSCSDQDDASPDTGCDSSDVGALGRSCDNFAEESTRRSDRNPVEIDEDTKRQSRLMRNRESATQSRLRKKSYVKELEAKCRAMESQMSTLHQTVAFAWAQNTALRDELAHYRCLKGNGSKSGAMEPAALPSDSLPSESPSRHTIQFPSVKWELVAFLYRVLLLTLLQVLHLKPATSEGKRPSKAESDIRHGSIASIQIERPVEAVEQGRRNKSCSFTSRKMRIVLTSDLTSDDILRRSLKSDLTSDDILGRSLKSLMIPVTWKPGHALAGKFSSTKCRISSKKSLKRRSSRSQYSSLA